jgi:hypothetical protein
VIAESGIAETDGIILVSFGSWLQPEHMPAKVIDAITSTLDKIPQLIFLKWNSSELNFGENVITRTWSLTFLCLSGVPRICNYLQHWRCSLCTM